MTIVRTAVTFQEDNAASAVGLSTVPGDVDFHTALWSNGILTDLGTFPGDSDSNANAINQRGEIVGASSGPNTMRAMLWKNGVGIDLNTLIPASSGWQLLYAIDINARGQITGWGIHNNPNGLSAASSPTALSRYALIKQSR